MHRLLALLALLLATPALAATPGPCPSGLPAGTACFRDRDANGAFVFIARPAGGHGGLVVHTYGGPRLAAFRPETTDEDVQRFAEFIAEGWDFVVSSRRRPGFGVAMGAEDTENARRLYVASFARPRITVAHGQSWGAAIAAALIERHNAPEPDGRRPYDAALLTAGVLAGGTRAYDMRVDLRAAFQAICGTHPAPGEPAYDVTLGLAPGARMSREDLERRLRECTGIGADGRTAAQARAAADLAAASRIPESAIMGHLAWATQVFRDVADNITGGRSAFGNAGVAYRGTSDDAGLNARTPRFTPDPAARAALAADSDLTGRIGIPVLSMHGIGDQTVFVESQSAYAATVAAAGESARLVQVFVDESAHSKMASPLYPAALAALAAWAADGARPDASGVLARCEALRARFAGECRIRPEYRPQAWEARVNNPR
jgi:alpha-beta hydrolase superfamily lysophospholipase